MGDLLDSVLNAHGGLDRWHQLSHVRACIVTGGELWGIKGLVQDQPPRQMTVALRRRTASGCRRSGGPTRADGEGPPILDQLMVSIDVTNVQFD